jgi:hypothetical protein
MLVSLTQWGKQRPKAAVAAFLSWYPSAKTQLKTLADWDELYARFLATPVR